jgi:hypothetical protein
MAVIAAAVHILGIHPLSLKLMIYAISYAINERMKFLATTRIVAISLSSSSG